MTLPYESSGESRLAQVARPSEASQIMSVQTADSMDQFTAIKNAQKKCTVDLPAICFEDKQGLNEKQVILMKEKKAALENPPDKNDGYMIAEPMHKEANASNDAHNKKVFTEVDTNHNGRLSLDELKHAIHDPNSDLTKLDIMQLKSQEGQILKHIAISGASDGTHRYDPSLRQYIAQNHLMF